MQIFIIFLINFGHVQTDIKSFLYRLLLLTFSYTLSSDVSFRRG